VSELKVFLAGNPNCGKSTLFNLLTGIRQKISNIPGTTVEKVTGRFKLDNNAAVEITDLPGAYSLIPKSEDELVAARELIQQKDALVVYVADATRLESNLYYFSQIADLRLPMILVLNMIDLTEEAGLKIDVEQLSAQLGVLVVPMSARHEKGVHLLKKHLEKPHQALQTSFLKVEDAPKGHDLHEAYRTWVMSSISDESVIDTAEKDKKREDSLHRHQRLNEILKKTISRVKPAIDLKSRFDKLLTHPVYGLLILFAGIFLIFQAVFKLAEFPMDGIEWLFSESGALAREVLPGGFLTDFLVEGLISGLAGIVVFLPQIVILFFFIGLMEETGYMTRVSFLTDRFMRRFGLNGKSIIPLAGGMACAIPSIMAARTIENKIERLATIMVVPLMSCSARLPVYTLLISLLVPADESLWIFNLRGAILMLMYLLGFVSALLFSLVFSLFVKSKVKDFFVMEMPVLRGPRWKSLFVTVYMKGLTFLTVAGKVIFVVSIILFLLKSFGPSGAFDKVEEKYSAISHEEGLSPEMEAQKSAELLEVSWIGVFGKVIEPVIKPLGYDWKIGISLITSFAAREVFVGTMSIIYGVADDPENLGLREKLRSEINPATGKPIYSTAVVISLIIFYAFALQCMSTIAVVYKETNSIKWPVIQLVALTGAAYLFSFIAYQLLS
jgi:ferrous iron transport protein B